MPASALTAGGLHANLNLLRCIRGGKDLAVRIQRNKLYTLHAGRNHPVNRIAAAAANADYLNSNAFVDVIINFKIHEHIYFLLSFSSSSRSLSNLLNFDPVVNP